MDTLSQSDWNWEIVRALAKYFLYRNGNNGRCVRSVAESLGLSAARTFSTRVKITLTQNTNNIFEILLRHTHTNTSGHTLANTNTRLYEYTNAAALSSFLLLLLRAATTTTRPVYYQYFYMRSTYARLRVCVCVCNIFIITATNSNNNMGNWLILTFIQPTHLIHSLTHTHVYIHISQRRTRSHFI